jgi:hypothetical protein
VEVRENININFDSMRYISLSNYDTSYNSMMKPGFTYIELAPFSKRRNELIGDHGLMALQSILNKNPESGEGKPH